MTAKDFLIKNRTVENNDEECLIKFAKYHLQQAETAWFEKIKSEGLVTNEGVQYLRNVYSAENIK